MKTVINARIETKLKKELEVLAKQMGLSLSSLISASLTKVAKDKKLEMSGLTENGFTHQYEQDLLNDPDSQETVFVAKNMGDTRRFFESLND